MLDVYVVTADVYEGTPTRWVVGVYTDWRMAEQVAGEFPELRGRVHGSRTVDESTPEEAAARDAKYGIL